MTLTLYTTTSDPRVVDKQLSIIASGLTIHPLQNFNIITPVIYLDYADSYLNANYAYIPDLHRYYFVNNLDLELGKRIIFSLSVDVLMTYANQIRACNATVVRSEMFPPNQVPDDKLPVDPNARDLRVIEFLPESAYPLGDSGYLLGVM